MKVTCYPVIAIMATAITYFFTPLVLMFLSEECHDTLLVEFDFFDAPCLKMAISKGLGVAIILGSALVKIPQIIKLMNAKSAVGLSLNALLMEMLSITFTTAYSVHKEFPFSAWGECLFMSIQNLIIVVLVFVYGQSYSTALFFVPSYLGLNYFLCSAATPIALVMKLQQSTLVILIISRFLQIWENFSNGHTGQLSLITTVLLAGGSLARVFTSVQETGDYNMILQFLLACSLNCLILGQIMWYWDASKGKKTKSE